MILRVGSGIRRIQETPRLEVSALRWVKCQLLGQGRLGWPGLERELGSIREMSSLSLGNIQVKMTKRVG